MRKVLLLVTMSLSSLWLISCGSSSKQVVVPPPPPQPSITTFAFMQEAGNYLFSPMLGTFTTTNGTTVFAASAVVDPSTNQPVTGGFYSIILSPDGKKAAIDLYGGLDGDNDQLDIFVADASGSGNPVEVTNDAYEDLMPQFSPDGSKVVFASLRPIPGDTNGYWQWQIAIMNADGSGAEQVLPIAPGIVYQMAPTFSPNGKQIATQAIGNLDSGSPFQGILLTNIDGSNPIYLTNPLFSDTCDYCEDQMPSFSPDGSKIVFSRENYTQSPSVSDIYVMNADGTNVTKLTDGVGINSDPLLLNSSELSGTIVFNSNRDNLSITSGAAFDLYSIKTDGTGLTRLTNNTLFEGMCGWWYTGTGGADTATRRANPLSREHHPTYRGRPAIRGLHW